ncbi:hypothetical protein PUN28_017013 [Cardiocondyla obscurior]|uniref:BRCT domain-containing protein n=1 Tax=Cardiocondyla obscurior TaxID=286306 RepID=A0AAW2ENP2_9HYME
MSNLSQAKNKKPPKIIKDILTHSTTIIEEEENIDGNVSEVVQVDLGRISTDDPTKKAKELVPTKSESIQNRFNVKFLQLGIFKRERSMLANVQISPVHNMQQMFNNPDKRAETESSACNLNCPETKSERIESENSLLARQMDTKTPENVAHQFNKRDLCFTCSCLSEARINVVKKLATIYNASYVKQFNQNVTHVIMKTTGEENVVETSLKCLQGIAHRKWIVSFRWVKDCIKQQKLLNELLYGITTLSNYGGINTAPRNSRLRKKDLFKGFTFLCVGLYNYTSLSQYQDLLVATGARVIESFDIFAKLKGVKGVVIQDDVYDEEEIVFNITPYMLSSKDYYAIGYPRDIVDEEESYYDV